MNKHVLEQILDLARWAPSGDNTQPWRFEIASTDHVVVHGYDTREHVVYDFDGHASQMSIGAMLETLRIAASGHGLRADIARRTNMPDTRPTFDVRLISDASISASPLIPSIHLRSVQRRLLRMRPLSATERSELETAVGPSHRVIWKESLPERFAIARVMFANAKLRLTMPEAYAVHSSVIDWNARFSEDKVPDQSIGLDPVTTRLMRWVMVSWDRVEFFNTYFAGTLLPRLELDLVPGIACAAHFAIVGERPPASLDDYVSGGVAMQRFWLTATKLGLQVQPEMTPIIFAAYVRAGKSFTSRRHLWDSAKGLRDRLERILGTDTVCCGLFLGRIGAGKSPRARSLRVPLGRLTER